MFFYRPSSYPNSTKCRQSALPCSTRYGVPPFVIFSSAFTHQIQAAIFHPSKPILFMATKVHVRVYHLVKQGLIKKLLPGSLLLDPNLCFEVPIRLQETVWGGGRGASVLRHSSAKAVAPLLWYPFDSLEERYVESDSFTPEH
jgi:hypothetical protein